MSSETFLATGYAGQSLAFMPQVFSGLQCQLLTRKRIRIDPSYNVSLLRKLCTTSETSRFSPSTA